MTSVFISPHNDDETLFGAFTLIRERPFVVVCLRSHSQEHTHRFDVTYQEREAETAAAMEILGCEWEQWPFLDTDRIGGEVAEAIADLSRRFDRCYAPAFEDGGHPQHNRIAEIARDEFGPDRVTPYMTYRIGSNGEKSPGQLVPIEWPWIELKLRALACYRSQMMPSTGPHFLQPLHEWYQMPRPAHRCAFVGCPRATIHELELVGLGDAGQPIAQIFHVCGTHLEYLEHGSIDGFSIAP